LTSPTEVEDDFEKITEYPLGETVRVEILAPEIFKKLRQLDGFNDEVLWESLTPKNNIEAIFKAGES